LIKKEGAKLYNFFEEKSRLLKMGINVSVFENFLETYHNLDIDSNDGLIKTLPSGTQGSFQIRIVIDGPHTNVVVPATVQGRQKTITKLKNKSEEKSIKEYNKNVTAKPLYNKEDNQFLGFTTMPPDHSVKIFSVTEDVFRMHEVAIVTRIQEKQAHYFLTIQEVYRADLFQDRNKVWISSDQYRGYTKWESLQKLLPKMVEVSSLPNKSEYEHTEKKQKKLKKNEARVIFFNLAEGWGLAITSDRQVANVHWSQIFSKDRFKHLAGNQVVSFNKIEETERGRQLKGIDYTE
jgi:cold shock CspA family protein